MTFSEYQTAALTTAQIPLGHTHTYLSLGLCAEVGELAFIYRIPQGRGVLATEILKELGDVCWYAAVELYHCDVVSSDALPVVMEGDITTVDPIEMMFVHAGAIANHIKKVIRDGIAVDKVMVATHLSRVLTMAKLVAERFNFTLSDVFQMNIDKLADRKKRNVIAGSGDNR
jgi:NTP pyrophosphatase (non-canonical NTP hydrolase)